MKSKSKKSINIKSRTRKNIININSKTLKSIKKYTYKNKGGAPLALLAGKAAMGIGKVTGKAALSVGKVAARQGTKLAKASAKKAAKQLAKQAARRAAKRAAREAAKLGKDLESDAKTMMKDTSLINESNNESINETNNDPKNKTLNTPRKAVHNQNSKTYLCDPTNFEIILPPTHKSSSSIMGKKNNTYYKINIPKDTKAGSRVRFKDKLIIKNVGQNHPNCDKQILNIVNHNPTPGSGINENSKTAPKKTTNNPTNNPTKKTINDKLAPGQPQSTNDTTQNVFSQVISRSKNRMKDLPPALKSTYVKGQRYVPPERLSTGKLPTGKGLPSIGQYIPSSKSLLRGAPRLSDLGTSIVSSLLL